MKKFSFLSLIVSTALVSSCASISDVVDDDVYVMKGPSLPIGESLDDETAYSTYKYKKDKTNSESIYYHNYDSRFSDRYGYSGFGNPYSMMHFGNRNPIRWVFIPGRGWVMMAGFGYNPYGFGYNPYGYGGFGGYGDMYGYGYDPYFDMHYNPYYYGNGFYSNNFYDPWGWNSPWGNGWNNYGWGGNNFGNNGWNNNGWNNNGGGTTTKPNHHSGPRGSYGGGGISSRPSVGSGVVKVGQSNPSSYSVSNIKSGSRNGVVAKPVGKEEIISSLPASKSGSSFKPSDSKVQEKTYNRPGQVTTNATNTSGRNATYQTTSGAPSRTGNQVGNSGSSSRTGNSGGSVAPSRNANSGGSVSPSRNSGGSGSSVSPSRNGGSGSSGGSVSPSRGGSSGSGSVGGRRP